MNAKTHGAQMSTDEIRKTINIHGVHSKMATYSKRWSSAAGFVGWFGQLVIEVLLVSAILPGASNFLFSFGSVPTSFLGFVLYKSFRKVGEGGQRWKKASGATDVTTPIYVRFLKAGVQIHGLMRWTPRVAT